MRLAVSCVKPHTIGKKKYEAEQTVEHMLEQLKQIEDALLRTINSEVVQFYDEKIQLVYHLQSHLTK